MIEFALQQHSGVPIYRQIQDQIRLGVATGRLKPGDQLPTMRALAVELSVNPNTVIKAYTELEREGVLTTEQGTGTFVAPARETSMPKAERKTRLDNLCVEFLSHAGRLGFSADEVLQAVQKLNVRT